VLETTVKEITTDKIFLKFGDEVLERKNDAVIVCAGGELPTPMLKKMGVQVNTRYGD
jgi:NADH dehydrogenase FAD-containing subunit